MFHYVSGDILKTDCEALVHGIAPHDHFNQGLALSLRENWPGLYKDFRHYCHQSHPKEGGLWTWKGAGGPFIINLFTQCAPKDHQSNPGPATGPQINSALKNLVREIQNLGLKSIAMPKIATGVGRMDWSAVHPLIEAHLGDLQIKINIYETYKKGEKAKEALEPVPEIQA